MTTTLETSRELGVALAVAAALCFAFPTSTPALDAGTRGANCGPHADHTPREATAKQLGKALGCLINAERAERDRKQLRPEAHLTGLAKRHTKVMLKEECFDHECPGEESLRQRIERSGYVKGGGRYGYGENLGCAETPAGMIDTWMDIPFHKKNIVDGRFRQFGIGAKQGSPFGPGGECRPGRRYVTYTVIFGWRKPAG